MFRELELAIGVPLLVLLLAVLALEQWRDQLPAWLQWLAERPSWIWNIGIGRHHADRRDALRHQSGRP